MDDIDEFEDFVMGNENVERLHLPGGLRIVCEHLPDARSVSLGIWVDAGSKDDAPGKEGAAHFIEHMLFKGTPTRSARDISEEIDSVGGVLNAFTAKEHTCIYAKVLVEDFDLAASVLTDMVANSTFYAEHIEKERSVILEEISTYEDAPDELVLDLLESAIWGQSSMGKPILGFTESIEKIAPRDIIQDYRRHYTPSGIVVSIAGGVSLERAVSRLADPLKMLAPATRDKMGETVCAGTNVRLRKKQVEQVHFCLGAPGLPADHKDQYAMYVLNNALGGGPSSRLFQKVREEQGLAYSIYSFHSSYKDTGVFGIYAAFSPGLTRPVHQIIEQEILDLLENPMPERELERCKRQLKGSLVLGLEGTSGRMMRLGRSELMLSRVVPLQEVIGRIMAVTSEDVMNLAGKTFDRRSLSYAAVGPELDEIEEIAGGR